jgi:Phosphate-induced protein 1 conserved region.
MKKYLFSFTMAMLMAATSAIIALGQPEIIIHHKINTHAQRPDSQGFALTTGGTAALSPLVNHGGPLIGTPTIYLIWYGNWNQSNGSKGDTPAGQALIRQWANDIGNSPYYKLNSSLSAGTTITGNAVYGGETTDTGTSTRLSDSGIQTIVRSAISSRRLPYDPNGVYFVITSSNVSERSGFCTQYCGWHTATTLSGSGPLRYSFVGNASRCLSSCAAQSTSPNGLPGIDGAISVLSHELEEANTDPDLNAWYDSSGAENADKCAWTFGHAQFQVNGAWANQTINGHNYLIQRNILKSGSNFFCMVNSVQN